MSSCSVPLCKSNKRKTPGISFHEFPSKEPRRSQWIRVINKCDGSGNGWQPYEHSVICSLHFQPEDFKPNCKHRLLLPNAVPKIFHSNARQKQTKPRQYGRILQRSTKSPVPKSKSAKPDANEGKENNENQKSDEVEIILADPEPAQSYEKTTVSIGCQTEILSVNLLRRYQEELKQTRHAASRLVLKLEMLEKEIKDLVEGKTVV